MVEEKKGSEDWITLRETSESDEDFVKKSKPLFVVIALGSAGQLSSFQYDKSNLQLRISKFIQDFSQAYYATITDIKDEELRAQIQHFIKYPDEFIITRTLNENKIYQKKKLQIDISPMITLFHKYMVAMMKCGLYSTIDRRATIHIGEDYKEDESVEELTRQIRELERDSSSPEEDNPPQS